MLENQDHKYGKSHATPEIIKFFVAKAIYDHTLEVLKNDKLSYAERDQQIFPVSANNLISEAINEACQQFDKHGYMAGFIGRE